MRSITNAPSPLKDQETIAQDLRIDPNAQQQQGAKPPGGGVGGYAPLQSLSLEWLDLLRTPRGTDCKSVAKATQVRILYLPPQVRGCFGYSP